MVSNLILYLIGCRVFIDFLSHKYIIYVIVLVRKPHCSQIVESSWVGCRIILEFLCAGLGR